MRGMTQYWNTGLAVLVGVFLVLMAFGLGVSDSDDFTSAVNQILIWAFLAVGVPGLALLGGLWNLRSGRYSRAVSYVGIVIGLVAAMMWFWWLLLPPIAALVVLWFGVIRQGLARELATTRPVSG